MPKSIHHPDHPAVEASRRRAHLPAKKQEPTYHLQAPIVDVTQGKQGKILLPDQMDGLPSSVPISLLPVEQRSKAKKGAIIKIGMVGTEAKSATLL